MKASEGVIRIKTFELQIEMSLLEAVTKKVSWGGGFCAGTTGGSDPLVSSDPAGQCPDSCRIAGEWSRAAMPEFFWRVGRGVGCRRRSEQKELQDRADAMEGRAWALQSAAELLARSAARVKAAALCA